MSQPVECIIRCGNRRCSSLYEDAFRPATLVAKIVRLLRPFVDEDLHHILVIDPDDPDIRGHGDVRAYTVREPLNAPFAGIIGIIQAQDLPGIIHPYDDAASFAIRKRYRSLQKGILIFRLQFRELILVHVSHISIIIFIRL